MCLQRMRPRRAPAVRRAQRVRRTRVRPRCRCSYSAPTLGGGACYSSCRALHADEKDSTSSLGKSARGDTRGRGEVRVDEYGAVRTGQGHAVRERCLLAAPDDALVLVEQSARAPWCTIWSTFIYDGRRVTSRSLMSAHQLCRSATRRAPLRAIASSSSVPSSILSSTRVGLMLMFSITSRSVAFAAPRNGPSPF